jgi:hypothetical protein
MGNSIALSPVVEVKFYFKFGNCGSKLSKFQHNMSVSISLLAYIYSEWSVSFFGGAGGGVTFVLSCCVIRELHRC